MSVIHQVGHDGINLVLEPQLHQYQGMVCSPLNYSEEKVKNQIIQLSEGFDSVFDPHLYFPQSERGKLKDWSYFPEDYDSADRSNMQWWQNINDKIMETCIKLNCSHICSPCFVPPIFSNDYYKFIVDIGNDLYNKVNLLGFDFLQTIIIDYNSIKEKNEVEIISSIVSQSYGDAVYLIIKTDVEPRKELADYESLAKIMQFIHLLKKSGINIVVAFCSSEFLLWKYAGADIIATGKFFNLRRFTCSRFEEPTGGGGQLPYWFEKNLMAYLRESDLLEMKEKELLHQDYQNNPFSMQIIDLLENNPSQPWLGLSWKNYLYAFAELENNVKTKEDIDSLLKTAENNWISGGELLMEEVTNDGSWIRQWRRAVQKFNAAIQTNQNNTG